MFILGAGVAAYQRQLRASSGAFPVLDREIERGSSERMFLSRSRRNRSAWVTNLLGSFSFPITPRRFGAWKTSSERGTLSSGEQTLTTTPSETSADLYGFLRVRSMTPKYSEKLASPASPEKVVWEASWRDHEELRVRYTAIGRER